MPRGFDFTGYKRASLMRRVRHRMDSAGYQTFEEYLDALQANPDEFDALFNTILINVTAFFRDPPAWDFIRDTVVPELLAARGPKDQIRVWSAGCASGQEAYSAAILLAEAIGPEDFRRRVKIYATDVDEHALAAARAGSYTEKELESVPADLRSRYFEPSNGRFLFRKDLRRGVIFGRNDLVKDAPISRVDLLLCRNTLMYLNGETQKMVLGRLHFALAPQGFIFLGHAEMLLSHSDKFTAVDMDSRVFRKAAGSQADPDRFDAASPLLRHGDLSSLDPLRECAFRAGPVPQIVVTGDDTVAMVNEQAERIFALSPRDVGRLLRDLEFSYRPLELRSFLERVKAERRSTLVRDVRWRRSGVTDTWYEVHFNPLVDNNGGLLGISIAFFDVTSTRGLLDKVTEGNRQLESAYEELQSTNEELETTNEELETTNEELQSTIEELETTNEELQSTNEELETMNEELQSTNDELHTINDTLRERSVELDESRSFVRSLLDSIHLGLIIVDREMRVVAWNRGSEDMWGLRSEEAVGKPLPALDIGLPTAEIKPLIGGAFVDPSSMEQTVVDATNRRGRDIRLRITCRGFGVGDAVNGALLLMEAQR
ncbi:chemotaxis protein CheR [Mycolicibacterium doricum]|uniref:protein-glutamate O-methyltransferase n=1 Tax=Mycolicibacterium doricum TaxID=126673 RepID=A0A7I7VUC6_9MYCO|nr:chemotaxis protein CheR [Mycolicibacterium doricum]